MKVIIVDDEKLSGTNPLTKGLEDILTADFLSQNVISCEKLGDAENTLNKSAFNIGIFDLHFNENALQGLKTNLMGINLFYIARAKASEENKPFVGLLYTFKSAEDLKNENWDLKVFVEYLLPEYEKEGILKMVKEGADPSSNWFNNEFLRLLNL